jgi:hypothetical protein
MSGSREHNILQTQRSYLAFYGKQSTVAIAATIIVSQTKLNLRVSFMRFCQRTEHKRLHKPDGTEFAFVH